MKRNSIIIISFFISILFIIPITASAFEIISPKDSIVYLDKNPSAAFIWEDETTMYGADRSYTVYFSNNAAFKEDIFIVEVEDANILILNPCNAENIGLEPKNFYYWKVVASHFQTSTKVGKFYLDAAYDEFPEECYKLDVNNSSKLKGLPGIYDSIISLVYNILLPNTTAHAATNIGMGHIYGTSPNGYDRVYVIGEGDNGYTTVVSGYYVFGGVTGDYIIYGQNANGDQTIHENVHLYPFRFTQRNLTLP